jgi:hypothetical protein
MEQENTKEGLNRDVEMINALLNDIGVDMGLHLRYNTGQPRLHDKHDFIASVRESKPNMGATLYAVKRILLEITIENNRTK